MNGYIAQRRGRFYVVIYEGRDPVTGKERRQWHPAGTDRGEAERLATKLAGEETRRVEAVQTLTFGAYLTSQWLPAKKLHLATSTYKGYERNVRRHALPILGCIGLRRLRYHQIDSLYDTLLHPTEGVGLSPKTVYDIHLLIRGSLADALRRGLMTRNVDVLAHAPKQRSSSPVAAASCIGQHTKPQRRREPEDAGYNPAVPRRRDIRRVVTGRCRHAHPPPSSRYSGRWSAAEHAATQRDRPTGTFSQKLWRSEVVTVRCGGQRFG